MHRIAHPNSALARQSVFCQQRQQITDELRRRLQQLQLLGDHLSSERREEILAPVLRRRVVKLRDVALLRTDLMF